MVILEIDLISFYRNRRFARRLHLWNKMLSKEFIKNQKEQLTQLGDKLHKESIFASQLIESNKRPQNEVSWFRSVRSIAIHGTFQIQVILQTIDSYEDKSEEQIGYYIGKTAIQSFLEIINAFEKSTNTLVVESKELKSLLNQRISEKVKIIEKGWRTDVNNASRKLKKSLINTLERKVFEMKFIRDTLNKHKIIDPLDYKILEFAWNVRNSMHTDFLAIQDMEFSAPGTSLNYSFKFKKGEELFHPSDLSSFYVLTEQIIFIQHKVLQHFNGIEEKNQEKGDKNIAIPT